MTDERKPTEREWRDNLASVAAWCARAARSRWSWPGLAGATVASIAVGLAVQIPGLLVALNVIAALPVFFGDIWEGRRRRAAFHVAVWAATLGLAVTVLAARFPLAARHGIWLGEERARELHSWIATGGTPEADVGGSLRDGATELGLFAVASAPTVGVGGLGLGAWRLQVIGASVGAVAGTARSPGKLALLGWAPWHLAEIAGCICLLAALADLALTRLRREPVRLAHLLRGALPGLALVIVSWAAELALSPVWQAWMHAVG